MNVTIRARVMKGWVPVEDRPAKALKMRRLRRNGGAHEMTARMWDSWPLDVLEAGMDPEDFGWVALGSMGVYEAPLSVVLDAHGMLVAAMVKAGASGEAEVAECALAKWMHESERCGCWDQRREVEWQQCEWRAYGTEEAALVVAYHASNAGGSSPEEHTYGAQEEVLQRWYDVALEVAKERREYEEAIMASRSESSYMK